MAQTMEDVKRKVRSLLTLAAEGSGATDPERATARRLADGLMASHGLREGDVPERDGAPRRPLPPPPPESARTFTVYVAGMGFFRVDPDAFGFKKRAWVQDDLYNGATGSTTGL